MSRVSLRRGNKQSLGITWETHLHCYSRDAQQVQDLIKVRVYRTFMIDAADARKDLSINR